MNGQVTAAIVAILVIIPLLSIGLWNSDATNLIEKAEGHSKIVAIASFYPLYEFTKALGGDKVDVSLLVPIGVEPHDWEPTIRDIQRIEQADLIIINGLGIENWADDIITINSEATVVDTSHGITPITVIPENNLGMLTDDVKELTDPHIWLNPITIKIQVQNIANALIKLEPENRNYYQKNADSYKLKLDILDKKIRDDLSKCNKRDFFAFHNAFAYFAKEYGLNQYTVIKSMDPLDDPTAKEIQEVIDLAKTLETNVIFTEEFVNPRVAQVIADETSSRLLVLSPLEFSDQTQTYLERMEENLSNLKEALCN